MNDKTVYEHALDQFFLYQQRVAMLMALDWIAKQSDVDATFPNGTVRLRAIHDRAVSAMDAVAAIGDGERS